MIRAYIRGSKLGRLATAGMIGLALGTYTLGLLPMDRVALAAKDDAARVVVSVQHGLLSVQAENAALVDVLREIAKQADFQLVIHGELEARISWAFANVPVADGVGDLLQNFSSVLIYASTSDRGPGALAEVLVLRTQADSPNVERNATNVRVAETDTEETPQIPLFQSIDASDREEHLRTLRGLTRQPNASVVKSLVYLLDDDQDPTIRSMAAIGLGKVRVDAAKAALIAALSDEDTLVRRRAVQALGRRWGNDAVEPLSMALLSDPDPTIRREAALRLGRITSEESLVSLSMAESDTDDTVRRAVEHAMAQIGGL